MSARAAFEDMKDVIIAYPFGDQKLVEVHVKKAGAITEKAVKEIFAKNKSITFGSISEKLAEASN